MSWRKVLVCSIAGLCAAKEAAAHAPPKATGIRWLAGEGAPALVRTNRGLVLEDSAERTFRIVCNEAFHTSLVEEPPVVVLPDGRLLLGTYAAGLVLSSADGCGFESVGGAFEGLYPIDVKADAQGVIYAAALPLDGSSAELMVSVDQGRSGQSLTALPGSPTALEIAPSDNSRLYVSITTAQGELSFGSLLTSSDAGRSFEEHPIELDAAELRVFLLAVAPNEPQLSFVRTQSRDGITPERLLRSEDGGETFETVLSAPGPISAAVQPDGTVWAGAADGLYRSRDAGRSFVRVAGNDLTRITCLATRDDALYACAYSAGEFGVLVSANGGDDFEWFLRFPQVTARLDCPADTDEGASCGDAFADWALEQELGSTTSGGEAGSPATPATPAGPDVSGESGCGLAGGVKRPSWALLATLGFSAARRCRRRTVPAKLNDGR
jgi:hypothetical protein